MMSFAAILFDCDGTLVDSERLGTEVLHQAATAFGFDMPLKTFRETFRGRHFAHCQTAIEASIGHPLPPSFVPDVRVLQAQLFARSLAPIEGIPALLDAITTRNIPRCVASGAPLSKIESVLAHTRLRDAFGDLLFSSYALDMWKPAPDLFLHAAAALGVAPARCAVIEDSLVGVEAGIAAGMTVFHYTPEDGIHTLDAPAVTTFRHMDELHALLGLD